MPEPVIRPGHSSANVQSVTDDPAAARTPRPDVPIAQVFIGTVGAHTPPDPSKFFPDGRPR